MKSDETCYYFNCHLGDINPLDYGGMVLFTPEDGKDGYLALLEGPTEEDEEESYLLYRVELEHHTYENYILSDNKYHKDFQVWYGSSITLISSHCGMSEEELISLFCSEKAMDRAIAYRSVIDYYGAFEFDQYPISLTRKEAKEWFRSRNVPV